MVTTLCIKTEQFQQMTWQVLKVKIEIHILDLKISGPEFCRDLLIKITLLFVCRETLHSWNISERIIHQVNYIFIKQKIEFHMVAWFTSLPI